MYEKPNNYDAHKVFFAYRWVVDALIRIHSFQVVITDLGPSNDDLNRVILSSCDAVLCPFKPDHFGYSSFNQLLHFGKACGLSCFLAKVLLR